MRNCEFEFGLDAGPVRIIGGDENGLKGRNNCGVELCFHALSQAHPSDRRGHSFAVRAL